ncbi:MAG: DUF3494 domain-containing protein [Deltaproteobacteria bacterium]|nr:DUF3494 domain-containing protein [Nannocystaceae bacterium]
MFARALLTDPTPTLLLLALASACTGSSGGDSEGDGSASEGADASSSAGDASSPTADASADASGDGDTTAGESGGGTIPTVVSVDPLDLAIDVPLNGSVSAVFSEAMDADALTTSTFVVVSEDAAEPIEGTVIYADSAAFFWPAAHLASDTTFTATITTGARSEQGIALADDYEWSFTTGDEIAPGIGVDLRSAGDFAVLAKSAISSVPPSAITGDVGVSPAAATFITGFSLIADASNVFSTSSQVVGNVYAADYEPPTPSNMTTAISDMETAFTDAAGRAFDVAELGAGDIGGMTLEPGVYRWGTGLQIPTDVTLAGSANDVWIFQIAQGLTMASGASVVLSGGASADNVFWQVSGGVDLGTTAHCEGVILGQTSVALRTGASINGRLLAQTAIDLDASTVVTSVN